MDKLTERYTTKLELSNSSEISQILDEKLKSSSAERLVDYISLGLDNIDSQIENIKQAESELKKLKANLESQKDIIKVGASSWFSDAGVSKLNGLVVSSIKVTEPKPTEEVILEDEESLINAGFIKVTVDKTKVKQALLDGIEVEGARIEVTHKESSITVYKKRT